MSGEDEMFEELGRPRTTSIRTRAHKVFVADFAQVPATLSLEGFERLMPGILRARDLGVIVERFIGAIRGGRSNILAIGGHVLKCGLGPIIADMMRRGWVQALALNGAAVIHDLEIAMVGATSEDVDQTLPEGAFGMIRETPELIGAMFQAHEAERVGLGRALSLGALSSELPFGEYSVIVAAARAGVPVTVHIAVGGDTIHAHPAIRGDVLGSGSLVDFKRLAIALRGLDGGGCYWNVGSAVVLPEVFLKALALGRNVGWKVAGFTTVNLDMQRQYRTTENVVRRPALPDGRGLELIGHHEIMIPLLYASIRSRLERPVTSAGHQSG